MTSDGPPSRLARKLGTVEATLIGLGSMIGAGVFVVFGLAARAASGWLLIGLLLAAVVATCNAFSSAQLAALHPTSGGAYVYGRERLGPTWGFLAGWGFIFGKTASCAAMALAIGSYLAPDFAKAIALGSVLVFTAINYLGVERTARTISVLVPFVIGVLLLVVVSGATSDAFDPNSSWDSAPNGVTGILQAGALIFFAFAGYARIGTLGEEVKAPERTIPRAMILAVSIALVLYTLVAIAALGTLGSDRLASSVSPLADVTEMAGWRGAGVIVRFAAVVAASGALLTLLAGISRTVFAMAQNRDLPPWLGAVHERRRTPYRAEIVVGLVGDGCPAADGSVGGSRLQFLPRAVVLRRRQSRCSATRSERAPMAPVHLGRGSRRLRDPRSVPIAFHRGGRRGSVGDRLASAPSSASNALTALCRHSRREHPRAWRAT